MIRCRFQIIAITLICAGLFITWLGTGISVAADIDGHWEGAFTRDGAVQQVAFDFETTDSGLTGTYDIPDMILYREPVRELSLAHDTLSFRVFWGGFTCIVHDDVEEITGENPKWGPPVSIHLKRTFAPRHFRVEHLRFPSGSLSLAGDLLIPSGNPPFPAVVVIEGSSTEGRSLWTYRSIGDLFARNGVAALIYDKRGTGASEGDFDRATFDDLSKDVIAAVRFLRNRTDIDSTAVGLFGISQGGWLAPDAAVKSGEAAFVILLGGPAVSIWDQELQRVEYSMRAGIYGEDNPDVFDQDDIEAALRHTRLGFEVALNPDRWDEWEASVSNARSASWSAYVALDSSLDELQGWLRYRYDPTETLRHLRKPVLALFGTDDVLVPPQENVDIMRDLLAEAGNDRAKIVVFPNVGHDFFTGATLVGGAWEWPSGFWRWNRRAPGLADSIINWTQEQLNQSPR
jgi:pimeloyl-ACP methyl ester carboxylesterase